MSSCRALPAPRVRRHRQMRRSACAEGHRDCPQVQPWIGRGVRRRADGPVARFRSFVAAAAATHTCVTDRKDLLYVRLEKLHQDRLWKAHSS